MKKGGIRPAYTMLSLGIRKYGYVNKYKIKRKKKRKTKSLGSIRTKRKGREKTKNTRPSENEKGEHLSLLVCDWSV